MAQVPEVIFREHGTAGFRIATEDRELFVYAEAEVRASRWVEMLFLVHRLHTPPWAFTGDSQPMG